MNSSDRLRQAPELGSIDVNLDYAEVFVPAPIEHWRVKARATTSPPERVVISCYSPFATGRAGSVIHSLHEPA